MAQPDEVTANADPRSEPNHGLPDMEEADARNGEPGALDDTARQSAQDHRTGERQAQKNRETEPPA